VNFALRPDGTLAETEGGTVLLDQRRGHYFQLNDSGALVLRALLAGATVQGAAEALCDRYPVASGQAAADVTALLDALRTAKLTAG
jgi:hypothetical protein